MKYTPLRNLIVVKLDAESPDTLSTMLDIPQSAVPKSTHGTVQAVGPGIIHPVTGELMVPTVKPGDRVVVGKGSGQEVDITGEELLIIREDDIMVVLK